MAPSVAEIQQEQVAPVVTKQAPVVAVPEAQQRHRQMLQPEESAGKSTKREELPQQKTHTTFRFTTMTRTKYTKLAPATGSEVSGVQLSQLSAAGKDQLALVAQRKVVAFRDQDFADLPIKDALNFGSYFIHLVHRVGSKGELDNFFAGRNVSYEAQPPGTTFLYVFDTPETGGDTAFVNQVEAYNRLSPAIKQRLHGLKAVHSGIEQAEFSHKRGGVVRRHLARIPQAERPVETPYVAESEP
ncbi:hypothetical protein VC83_03736 [Pseudogymnoascus destructans]|uniref:TauD/TfdA-like domain-containing protein n=2 Tax=Pseudogymnoascus destructans TaxID=655981 RepID=L8G3I8_PSED2|nr:uncharacterized protein VC83_03736 [Pseudogymnoascus destructans]ELR07687.1 hypothetical protein GMDG_02709 [Pseudogymnoascus destructans 20631-21]OAF59857.1 hypothetical protein VC83_03736 [Pseudogymnoascus destructans]